MSRRRRRKRSREFSLSCGQCDVPQVSTRWAGPFRVGRDGDFHRVQSLYSDWLRSEIEVGRFTSRQLLEEIGALRIRCSCGSIPHQAQPLEAAAFGAFGKDIFAEARRQQEREAAA